MNYSKKHVGMIRYCSYWRKYSLILDVNGMWVTELDAFGEVNHGNAHKTRKHCTALSSKDKFYTVSEFNQLVNSNKA